MFLRRQRGYSSLARDAALLMQRHSSTPYVTVVSATFSAFVHLFVDSVSAFRIFSFKLKEFTIIDVRWAQMSNENQLYNDITSDVVVASVVGENLETVLVGSQQSATNPRLSILEQGACIEQHLDEVVSA